MFLFSDIVALAAVEVVDGGRSSGFVRGPNYSADTPLDSDVFRVPPGYNAPQQVHITKGDYVGKGEIMRVMYEHFLVKYKVGVIFAGHVHANERSERVSNIAYNIVNGLCRPRSYKSAPVYITVGGGGNLEGLAKVYVLPIPVHAPTDMVLILNFNSGKSYDCKLASTLMVE